MTILSDIELGTGVIADINGISNASNLYSCLSEQQSTWIQNNRSDDSWNENSNESSAWIVQQPYNGV